ncbi:MAG: hypothetical protein ACREOO_20195, partial [bacterium]
MYQRLKISAVLCMLSVRALDGQALTETKLTASDARAGDTFGFAVSLAGDHALIGASGQSSSRGAAYIFDREDAGGGKTTWREITKLTARDGTVDDFFGNAVALSMD